MDFIREWVRLTYPKYGFTGGVDRPMQPTLRDHERATVLQLPATAHPMATLGVGRPAVNEPSLLA
jgi:hypothetical protein